MAHLVLVRHGRSEWNDKGLWTGWTDINLNNEGRKEAKNTSKHLKDIEFHIAFTSDQKRAKETLSIILKSLKVTSIPVNEHPALRERNYGKYTGKNKWQVKKEVGEEIFLKIRRGWDHPIPDGESLKMVYERVSVHYNENIHPHLMAGKNVIVTASGNSLRALVKHLENISDSDISELEIRTAEAYVYQIDEKGKILSKQIRAQNQKIV